MKLERSDGERMGLPSEENELKICLSEVDFAKLQERVAGQGLPSRESQLIDLYYDDEIFFLTNLNRGLRVRLNGSTPGLLEFKSLFYIPDLRPKNPWLIEEVKADVSARESDIRIVTDLLRRLGRPIPVNLNDVGVEQLLEAVGLSPRIIVNKSRTEYQDSSSLWVFDRVDGLGSFVEVESESDSSPKEILDSFLGDSDYHVIREGYNDMIVRNDPAVIPVSVRQARFMENPRWNLLTGEDRVIQQILQR